MCTRIFMNMYPKYMVSARTLDFFGPVDPALIITPRGVARHGGHAKNAAQWKTQYGSVVIYANGIFPMDGMNEKGLAAHTLFYMNGKQEQQDNQDKPVIESRAWVSYILDNYTSVTQVVSAIRQDVRLVAVHLPIDYASDTKHIAIEDLSGDSAIIEIDDGKVNIYHDQNYRVMTNPPSYDQQLKNLSKFHHVKREELPGGLQADVRLVRASYYLKHIPQPDNKNQAEGFILSVINNVSYPIGSPAEIEEQHVTDMYIKYSQRPEQNKGVGTYWMTISDLSHGEYHFKSTFAASQVWVSLHEIDFSQTQPVRKITHLNDYAQAGWEGNILAHAK
ncbi:linear amide C-N hydrolase [Xenorhabdus griffiniae]|uniref:Linear amide C-N hydrolase n=1 Tax=Xenorhabdus griffiniae TaxID=351672 RepID=A0ABY9XD95_9GAMM|nr:linear amide C-N hydrolase [Xenorhabdus griffiniae]MBD1228082.1 linear amide C-N hydrolase [Xenorhabdus griffiniae]MBE8587502.1 linear amide C-N hydrolase [Xenorhabdus griffiniae]WMV70863.1 linear amide C-N hydrolase [Xenorhabdus griffiniae]WNH00539.1 linear amide C-N hydrolase [Xenorhabdus griffiniae]